VPRVGGSIRYLYQKPDVSLRFRCWVLYVRRDGALGGLAAWASRAAWARCRLRGVSFHTFDLTTDPARPRWFDARKSDDTAMFAPLSPAKIEGVQ